MTENIKCKFEPMKDVYDIQDFPENIKRIMFDIFESHNGSLEFWGGEDYYDEENYDFADKAKEVNAFLQENGLPINIGIHVWW